MSNSNRTPAQILPSGIYEIEQPYRYFLRAGDFNYLYNLPPGDKIQAHSPGKLSEEFLDLINSREYKKAEKWLISNYDHPYYLLNLILLYAYLDQPEYKNLFVTWQKAVDQYAIVNLIDIFSSRRFDTALEKLSPNFTSPDLKRYALYKVYRGKKKSDLVSQNFIEWGKESRDAPERKLYEQARADWLFDLKNNPALEKSDLPQYAKPSSKDIFDFENDLKNQKYTRDMLSRYIEYLLKQNKINEIRKLVGEIPWLTENEKKLIVDKVTVESEKSRQGKPGEDFIKVRINK